MSNQLKPCPFCGSNDVEAFTQDEDDCPHRSAIVRCHSCDAQSAQMVGNSKIEMAIRAWISVWRSSMTDFTELAQRLLVEKASREDAVCRM